MKNPIHGLASFGSALLATVLALAGGMNGAHGAVALAVVPNAAFDANGTTDNTIPFGATNRCEDGFRYQQLLDGGAIGSGNIDSIGFRLDEDQSSDLDPITFGGMKVKLSSASRSIGNMSETFADNTGPDETLVFSGDLTVGASVSGSTPHPFDFEIPVEAPFEFDGSSSDLLIDITVEDCPPDALAIFDADASDLERAYAWDKDDAVAENQSGIGLVTQLTVSTPGVVAPFYSCPTSGTADNLSRGFYLENYPGDRLDEVTLTYHPQAAGTYTVRLTAREGSYDGRVIGGPETRTIQASSGSDTVTRTFDFGGATVTSGATVAFSQELVSGPPGGGIFYDTGPCGFGGGCSACPDMFQTEGTSSPLDSVRRNSVGISVDPVTRMRGVGGNWTVVGHDGEGFMVHVTENNQLVVIWFTYDDSGNQMWLIGVENDFQGNAATMNLDQLTGPVFGPGFDPGDVITENWGTLSIRFNDCESGTVMYNSLTGFGSGSYDIARLYQTEQGVCP